MNNFVIFAITILAANAWWDQGHMLVSQIAYDHLTDTQRETNREQFDALIKALNPFTDGRSNSFAEAAVWADDIKGSGAKFFDNYHFTNMYRFSHSESTTPTSPSRA